MSAMVKEVVNEEAYKAEAKKRKEASDEVLECIYDTLVRDLMSKKKKGSK